MPPRYAYWTIILEGKPTAFRAHTQDELLPTLKQLQTKHPDAAMFWFARGRLWQSPEEERAAGEARRQSRQQRGPAWRPGGEHRDPRDRFKVPRDEKRRRFADKLRRDRQDGGTGGGRPDRPPTGRPDRPPTGRPDRPPTGRPDRPPTGRPDRPPTGRPDRPPTGRPDRPPTGRPDRPPTGRPDRPPTGRPDRPPTGRTDRPRSEGSGGWRPRGPGPGGRGDRKPGGRRASGGRPGGGLAVAAAVVADAVAAVVHGDRPRRLVSTTTRPDR